MSTNASAVITFGLPLEGSENWPDMPDELMEALLDDAIDLSEFKLQVLREGYESEEIALAVAEDLVSADDYSLNSFQLEELTPECISEWQDRFRKFCAAHNLPYLAPSYMLIPSGA